MAAVIGNSAANGKTAMAAYIGILRAIRSQNRTDCNNNNPGVGKLCNPALLLFDRRKMMTV